MLISSRPNRPFILACAAVLLGSMAQGQDLAAVAKKEKERRAKVTKPVKVLTEEDGKEATAKGAGSVTSIEPSGATTPAGSGAVTTDPDAQRAAWKARMDNAKNAVTTAENTLAQMEKDLNALRSDMSPVTAADAMDPMRLQKRDQLIFKLNKDIEAQKAAVVQAKKGVSDVEDAARKSGVPAGWLR
jgi:chromosome segregation ATPase